MVLLLWRLPLPIGEDMMMIDTQPLPETCRVKRVNTCRIHRQDSYPCSTTVLEFCMVCSFQQT